MALQRPGVAFAALALLFAPLAAKAQSVTLVAAGSLNLALSEVAQAFTAATGTPVNTTFAPSGTLRQQIEGGLRPDVFASADTGNPRTLEQEGLAGPVRVFARNQVVAVFRTGFGGAVGPSNLLDVLLNQVGSIGTSTPIADPLGDYTQEIFEKADAISPGAAATLEGKRNELVANPNAPAVPAGANSTVYFLDTTQTVDVFISYVTGAVTARAIDPTLQIAYLPKELNVPAPYGLTVVNGASAAGQQFADFILSPPGQQILASYGYIPACRSWARDPYRSVC